MLASALDTTRSARLALTVTAACFSLVALPSVALGQDPRPPPDWVTERADAGYVRDVGAGLTIAGLALTGSGTAIMFGIDGGFEGWGHIIGGGLLTGIGGILGLVGIPTWVAGGVRVDILSGGTDAERARAGSYWHAVGATIFGVSMGLATLGAVLLAAAHAAQSQELAATGFAVIPVGAFIAAFIGAPMWAEGARF